MLICLYYEEKMANVNKQFPTIMQQSMEIIVFAACLISVNSCPVFAFEILTIKREISTGIQITAYWLARILVVTIENRKIWTLHACYKESSCCQIDKI